MPTKSSSDFSQGSFIRTIDTNRRSKVYQSWCACEESLKTKSSTQESLQHHLEIRCPNSFLFNSFRLFSLCIKVSTASYKQVLSLCKQKFNYEGRDSQNIKANVSKNTLHRYFKKHNWFVAVEIKTIRFNFSLFKIVKSIVYTLIENVNPLSKARGFARVGYFFILRELCIYPG